MPARLWLLLGDIQSKIDLISKLPTPPQNSSLLRRIYLAKGVHSTTAIEGNSFSEEEVQKIINKELKAKPSRRYQQQQIDNMVAAFNIIADDQLNGVAQPFSLQFFNRYHAIVLADLGDSLAKDVQVGQIRNHRVTVGPYLAAPPEDCARLLEAFCHWLNQEVHASEGYELATAIVKALIAHIYFAWIHPYGDGNGRMARLIEFIILLQAGVPDVAAHLLSNFYNKTRDQYYLRLQETHGDFQHGKYPERGNLLVFIEYALQGFKDELIDQFNLIQSMQLRSIWHDSIHAMFRDRFGDKLTSARQRQKRLALDLSDHFFEHQSAYTKEEVPEISTALARLYSQTGERVIARDLNNLIKMGLLKSLDGKFSPNTGLLMSMFPNTRQEGA